MFRYLAKCLGLAQLFLGLSTPGLAQLANPTVTITAPTLVVDGQSSYVASVPAQDNSSYVWTITGGVLVGNSNSNSITFAPSPLDDPRSAHSATVLSDGSVLTAGGVRDYNWDLDATAAIFAPGTATFNPTLGNLISARSQFTATLLSNGQVLLIGGYGSSLGILSASEVYDPSSRQFLNAGALGIPRYQHTATLLQTNQVLVVGGIDAWGSVEGSGELFDPDAQTFSTSSGILTTPRTLHTASLLANGQVLLTGGLDVSVNWLGSAEIYDPASDQFLPASTVMNSSRYNHTATVLPNGQVLLVGGYGQDFYAGLGSAEIYDPTAGTFTYTAGAMSTPRACHTATLLANGTVLITGGEGSSGLSLNTGEIYDPATGLFTPVPLPMFTPRAQHTSSFLPDGRVLLIGGIDQNRNPLAIPEVYDPTLNVFEGTVGLTCTVQATGGTSVQGQIQIDEVPNPVPTISSQAWMTTGMTYKASVPDPGYLSFAWTVANGTITSTSNQAVVTFAAGNTGPLTLTCTTTPTSGTPPIAKTGTFVATVVAPSAIASFSASPTTVAIGGTTTLLAVFTGTGYVDSGVGPVTSGIPVQVTPSQNTTYTLYAYNAAGGSASQQLQVNYLPQQPRLAAPNNVAANGAGFSASVQSQRNCTYAWQISGGTILSGNGTCAVTFASGSAGTLNLSCTVTVLGGGSVTGATTIQVSTGGPATLAISAPTTVVAGTGGYTASVPPQDGCTLLWTIAGGALASDPTASQVTFAAGALGVPRFSHTATLMANGQVLLAGGQIDLPGDITASADLFDPGQSSFQTTNGAMSNPRNFHTATLLTNGQVLLVGGSDGLGNVLADADLYDPTTGLFADTSPTPLVPGSSGLMGNGRMGHATSLLADGTVLITGGYGPDGNQLSSADIFDPLVASFSPVQWDMSTQRAYHTSTRLLDGRVLLAGGAWAPWLSNPLAADLYDPASGSYSQTTGLMSTLRAFHSATLLPSGQVLLVGGTDYTGATLASAEIFDPTTGVFTVTQGSLANSRSSHTATLLTDGTVLVAGGTDAYGNPLASGEIFNPATGLFRTVSGSLQTGRAYHCATLLPGGLVLMTGGESAQPAVLARPEVYDPVAGSFGGTLLLTCTAINANGTASSPATARAFVTGTGTTLPPLTITPANAVLAPGGQQLLTASVPATWTCGYGTINSSSDGLNAIFMAGTLGIGSYSVTAASIADPMLTATTLLTVANAGVPLISSFTASPTSVHAGQSISFNWTTSNATTLTLTPMAGSAVAMDVIGQSGVALVPSSGMLYQLQASNSAGSVWAEVSVSVDLSPTARLSALATQVQMGGNAVLTPYFSNGVGRLDPGGLAVTSDTPVSLAVQSTTVYTLTVTNPYGATAVSQVEVDPIGPGTFLAPIPLAKPSTWARATRLNSGEPFVLSLDSIDVWNTSYWPPQVLALGATSFHLLPNISGVFTANTLTTCANGDVLASFNGDTLGTSSWFGLLLIDPITGISKAVTVPAERCTRNGYRVTLLNDGKALISGGEVNTASPIPALLVDINAAPASQVEVTGTPSGVRAGHVAIRLLDGRVLVAGGSYTAPGKADATPLTSAELYDPATRLWSTAGNLANSSDAVNAVLLPNGKVNFNGMELFDPATALFTPLSAPYPGFTGFGSGALLLQDGRILMQNSRPCFYDSATGACSTVLGCPSVTTASNVYLGLLSDGTAVSSKLETEWCSNFGTPYICGYSVSEFQHFDPQRSLSIQPAVGQTNVGVPLTLVATGSDSQGVIWSATSGTISTAGQFVSPSAGLVAVTATAPDGVKATVWVDVHPTVQVQISIADGSTNAVAKVPCQLQATVLNTSNQSVVWNVQEGTGAGTITQGGLFTAVTPGTYHILATSQYDPTVTAVLAITAIPLVVQVSPSFAIVSPGGSQAFQVTVNGGSVAWSVSPQGGGTIDQNGDYSAPTTLGTYTVSAVSTSDLSIQATASVMVAMSGTSGGTGSSTVTGSTGTQLTLFPTMVQTYAGSIYALNASVVGNNNPGVIWSLSNITSNATIDPIAGIFQANKAGVYQILATSSADPTAVAQSSITVASSLIQTAAQSPLSGLGDYSITALQDGTVLIAGGTYGNAAPSPADSSLAPWDWTYTGAPTSQAWIYNPSTGQYNATGSMITPRAQHQAILLTDGRVLIMGGYAYWDDPWWQAGTALLNQYPASEVYDPVNGVFESLPIGNLASPIYTATGLPVLATAMISLSGQSISTHPNGAALVMSDGRVLAVGGDGLGYWSTVPGPLTTTAVHAYNAYTVEPVDLFNPVNNSFDTSLYEPWQTIPGYIGLFDDDVYVGFGQGARAASLANGLVLLTGGPHNDLGYGKYCASSPAVDTDQAELLNPATMTVTGTGNMQFPRFAHTMTVLQDGRVLAVGGKDMTQAIEAPNSYGYRWIWATTNTAEIYDPATNTWTATGSLNSGRAYHSAQLLPSGQVLIVGGYSSDINGNVSWPNTTELYEPLTGTFSVMDTLNYGISNPQLALMGDNSVFVSGTEMIVNTVSYDKNETESVLKALDVGTTQTGGSSAAGSKIGPFYTVDVAIWESTFPYFALGGSIGHVFVGRPDLTVLLSQFPIPHGMTGVNTTKDWAATVAYEGCPPDHIYEIRLPNQAGFLAGVAANLACPTWNWYPKLPSQTNCTVSAYNSLTQGGLPLGTITLPESPLGLLTCLNNLISMQTAALASYNWHIVQIK